MFLFRGIREAIDDNLLKHLNLKLTYTLKTFCSLLEYYVLLNVSQHILS